MLANLLGLADDAASSNDLTNAEKTALRDYRDQLSDSVEALKNIIAAHDALQIGQIWDEPFDTGGNDLLCVALSHAFLIGSRAIENPITRRLKKESAARATQKRLSKSKPINNLIASLSAPVWRQHPQRTDYYVAGEIKDALNKQLQEQGRPELKHDAIRKRVRNLRTNARSSS